MVTNYINIRHHYTSSAINHMLLFYFVDKMQIGMYMQMVVGFDKASIYDACPAIVCLAST